MPAPSHPPPSCVIIGAGPAGISAAQWLHSLGVEFRWFDAHGRPGGMLKRVSNPIKDYPGGIYPGGPALIESLVEGLDACVDMRPELARVERISQHRADHTLWTLQFAGQTPIQTRSIILATGTTYRRLGIPGEEDGLGRYVSQSASADGAKFPGKPVAVIGGGDAAFEGALILAKTSPHVTILMRGGRPRARRSFQEQVQKTPNITIFPIAASVVRLEPSSQGCRLHIAMDTRRAHLEVACVFVRIGVEPALPLVTRTSADTESALTLQNGFIEVDPTQATHLPGIFAAGDITHCRLRAVATAVGTGATAARSVAAWLER